MSVDKDSPTGSDSVFNKSPTPGSVTDQLQENSNSFSYLASRDSDSCHSSRSSSFNDSAAEIILGLFQRDNRIDAGLGTEYTDEEDPAVRAMLIHAELQKPDSWVRRRLAMVQMWDDSESESEGGENSKSGGGGGRGAKRPRSSTETLGEEIDETRTLARKRGKAEGDQDHAVEAVAEN
ncbi:hypothetical protein L210DRAFT_3638872 [Boletus edulis BED1]|uniref:Uncharacterized protein n=1 Tax=Boletus edulis BED1 TaxID=1328754 RepID=A0AAD4GJ30_BOLED|nr:hypothetical protein L210DRAFT_3643474 [Boletus edulis BED1]KAF8447190.1 hypothetical protein L210DRAFT_3641154 [Boletus edulis BED1]KAF8452318.1 hypothetical protein L210DRAFT_3638872 [Boletus edulis BED1]